MNNLAENDAETFYRAAHSSCDFVEFDVQVSSDGKFVLLHDDTVSISDMHRRVSEMSYKDLVSHLGSVVTLEQAADILREKTMAHVDFKFTSPLAYYANPEETLEVKAAKSLLQHMPADACIITTLEDRSVKALREWSSVHAPDLLIGLSLGRDMTGRGKLRTAIVRVSEIFPEPRLRASNANLIVAHKRLAKLRLARVAQRVGLRLLVWTGDDPAELRAWLADDRVWLITTNYPDRAIAIREELVPRHP